MDAPGRLSCRKKHDERSTLDIMPNLLKPFFAGLALLAAVLIILAAGLPDRAQATAIGYLPNGLPIAPEIGGVAPSLGVTTLDGKPFVLPQNKPLVINFWATWCGPCAFELPLLMALQQKYPDVQIIAVNMGESANTVQEWLQANSIALTVALDPDQAAFRRYRVRGAPSTYFVDRGGVIRQIVYGALPPDGLEFRLKSILD